ncbi:arginine--tRNA ligase [Cloacibacterium normanense]|uniref:Arginine--tRNA ligase n=1 Tax=Cloacibacterium normanense TaxID=237258 RepID=A0A1E5UAV5_9FLAO|nr:arginine--tRNA ligase [Cloacibacterium normanense]AZI70139.1 arginine--tRNA ligase [Cloacibacterium normanense]OEL10073.1 arginine--tRNA ligase [Cloacibacterium normanense]SDO22757.1 arginyl-tRNA synthetase [Cloacibacterium normanense]
MDIKQHIQNSISEILKNNYQIENLTLEVQQNKTDFEGDFTVVIFPLVKLAKKSPDVLGNELGEELIKQGTIENINVVKGFLNLSINNEAFIQNFKEIKAQFDVKENKNQTVMVEYSSPNTNKPLHLGHIRNNLLGFSVAQILKEAGYNVVKTQIINDRGIHICKSMLAWEKFGKGETPETTGLKGDKLVGNYYVEFDKNYKAQISELKEQGLDEETAKKQAPIILEAQKMLLDWEQNKPEVRELWEKMNSWVYAGFNETYKRLGVDFDQVQYESNTYLLGKDIIEEGLAKGVFFKKEDNSVWIDLTEDGLDQKLVLRGDGTSVYMTQDLGTAVERFKQNDIQKLIYTVGNEQDYHFQVLFLILKKLGYDWANQLYHLSYGMVELPEGKMKSREGTVVDADDLMQEMYLTAKEKSEELGKLEGLSDEEKEKSYEIVGLGALKYFMLKVDPKKKMLFNPAESIDFNGNTGPFIQYTYARIQSLLNRANFTEGDFGNYQPNASEKELIMQLSNYKEVVEKAAETLSPAQVANYVYDLVKTYNSFYQNNPVMTLEDENAKQFKLQISDLTAKTIKKSLHLLGINVVNRM